MRVHRPLTLVALIVACIGTREVLAQPCQEVVLRDSIGVDNTTTNGNYTFASVMTLSQNPVAAVFPVTPTQDVTLSIVRVIGSKGFPDGDPLGPMDYRVAVWDTLAAVGADNNVGNIATIDLDFPTSGPNAWGQTAVWIPFGSYQTYEYLFDISSFSVCIPANTTRWISILFVPPDNKVYGLLESIGGGVSDYNVLADGTTIELGTIDSGQPRSLWDGRLGVEVRAVLVHVVGDLDADQDVDISDFSLLADCMAGPNFPGTCDPTIAARADIDVDGDVDMIDFCQFQRHFGESCP